MRSGGGTTPDPAALRELVQGQAGPIIDGLNAAGLQVGPEGATVWQHFGPHGWGGGGGRDDEPPRLAALLLLAATQTRKQ